MKIVHLITSMERGGAEKLLTDLLPIQRLLGCDVSLVSLSDDVALGPALSSRGVRVYTFSHAGTIYRVGALWKAIRRLRRFMRAERPDIVHSHLYFADVVSRLALPRGVKPVTSLHAIDPWWNLTRRVRSVLKTGLDSGLARLRGVRMVACSETVQKAALSALHVPHERIRVIYNGTDIQRFHPRNRRALLSDRPTIIQVGRLSAVKGHETSLRALLLVRERFPGARIVLVGDGELRDDIQTQADRLRLSESVSFLGLRDDVPDLLTQADIFWMPSLWEGLPIACLEAMACGLPVVATRVGGTPETIEQSVTGYLVDKGSHEQLADRTLRLISEPERALNMGRAARRKVEQEFTIDRTAAHYVQCYRDILDGTW